jgi:hypothetical protein
MSTKFEKGRISMNSEETFYVYSDLKQGSDDKTYSLRYLLTQKEKEHLQSIGLLSKEVVKVEWMQRESDDVLFPLIQSKGQTIN